MEEQLFRELAAAEAADGGTPRPVLVIGSANVDLVTRVRDFPRPGETLLGSDYETHHGGKGANQAVAAARMGAAVRFVGRVGSDTFGAGMKAALADEGIDTSLLGAADAPSGAAFITIDERGQNTIIVAPGANGTVVPELLAPELFAGRPIVLLQLEIPLATVRRAIELGGASGGLVVVNAAPAGGVSLDELAGAQVLVVNETEAAALLGNEEGEHQSASALARLAARIPRVLITLGEQGAIWRDRETAGELPAFPVRAVDTTAAGDAFVGALAATLARGNDWREAVRVASAAGALTVTRPGAQPSLPRRDEVERFLDEQAAGDAQV
jgi:ribokinase